MNPIIKNLVISNIFLFMLLEAHSGDVIKSNMPRPPQAGNNPVVIKTDPQGNNIAIWISATAGNASAIYGSLYSNGSWQAPDKISQDLKSVKFVMPVRPSLCCDAPMHAIVVWVALNETSQSTLYAAAYVPGTAPTKIDTISVGTNYLCCPSLCCIEPGRSLVVWQQDNNQGHDIIYKAEYAPDQDVPVTSVGQVYATDGSTQVQNPRIRRMSHHEALVIWREFEIPAFILENPYWDILHNFHHKPLGHYGRIKTASIIY